MSSEGGSELNHDECMICLSPLLAAEEDDDDEEAVYVEDHAVCPEVGAVWPCGHCFHIKCWQQWNKDKCPICNQVASLFSKIYISAPTTATSTTAANDLSLSERAELERYRRQAQDEERDGRMLLRDMERRVEDDPEGAKMMMTMMMMVQSRDLRKTERALEASQEECQATKDILKVAQLELDEANNELEDIKPKMQSLMDEVDRLKRIRREAASHRSQEHKKQMARLEEKLERAKDKLALKNRQLSRRNKELASKRKIISSQKVELAAKGKEHQRDSLKTKEALQRTKKELELLRELDSFTMEESSTSLNLSLLWD